MNQADRDARVPSVPEESPPAAEHTPSRSVREIASELWHQQPGTRKEKPIPPESIRTIVNGLDRREITIAVVLTVLNLYLVLAWAHHLHVSPTKAMRDDATAYLETGLIATGIVVVGTVLRRRALLGFACFLAALDFLHYDLFLQFLLNVLLGAWLLWRAQQAQKVHRGALEDPVRLRKGRPALSGPSPSKRYTPPKRARTSRSR